MPTIAASGREVSARLQQEPDGAWAAGRRGRHQRGPPHVGRLHRRAVRQQHRHAARRPRAGGAPQRRRQAQLRLWVEHRAGGQQQGHAAGMLARVAAGGGAQRRDHAQLAHGHGVGLRPCVQQRAHRGGVAARSRQGQRRVAARVAHVCRGPCLQQQLRSGRRRRGGGCRWVPAGAAERPRCCHKGRLRGVSRVQGWQGRTLRHGSEPCAAAMCTGYAPVLSGWLTCSGWLCRGGEARVAVLGTPAALGG